MCGPVALAVASIGTSLVGGVMQGAAAQQQANAQAAASESRALMLEQQQKINQERGSYKRRKTMQRYRQVLSQNRAEAADRGLAETGTVIDIENTNAREAGDQLAMQQFNTRAENANLDFEARQAKRDAASYRRAGKSAFGTAVVGSFAQGFTTLGKQAYRRRAAVTA